MAGILNGLRVLDLTRGIAGPMTAMLLADYGGDVVRIEAPGGDGCEHLPGYAVWNRGKRRVPLDLKDPNGREQFLRMADLADILLESYRPGVTARLGIDYGALKARNERLIYASITGYGRDNPHSQRPGIEYLVTARAGLQWDQRSYYGTRMERIAGTDAERSSFAVPPGVEQTGCREGPIFLAVPWASIGAMLLAISGISAALYARERTGRGQLFETSLLQSAIMENAMGWQRVERMTPTYRLWYFDRRAPKGIFQASDGKWLHHMGPENEFIRENARLAATGSDEIPIPQQRIRRRFATNYEQDVENQVMQFAETARAIASLPRDEWIRRFAVANLSGQPILSPEEGLMDKPLEKEGVIVEIDDYELGRIRQVGHAYGFDGVENPPIRPRSPDTEAPESIIDSWPSSEKAMSSGGADPEAPLSGVLVLDFGLAIAGPYGAQVLADLGADVIKITTLDFNLTDAIYVGSNHGKRALALNLKDPRGQEVARRLIVKADIVHHNMRRGVAERLGIGYLQVKELNPQIIYCHTRGYEMNGPRTDAPGNDQMGNALGGSEYEAGGTHHGTAPIWHTVSFGDAGNGVLSANACVQALYHREKTGLGQFVHTSILNVAMLFNSYTYVRPDGAIPDRERIDAKQYGFSATRRLYETREAWICIFARHDVDWANLCDAVGLDDLAVDARFSDAASRRRNDAALAAVLEEVFRLRSAQDWFRRLDENGVPCEIASSTFARELFDDPAMYERGWVIRNPHAHLGQVEQVGMGFSFSATGSQNRAGAPVTGQDSREILTRLGFSAAEVDELVANGVVGEQQQMQRAAAV